MGAVIVITHVFDRTWSPSTSRDLIAIKCWSRQALKFTQGFHTVRRCAHVWSGLLTDLTIQQTLMSAAKGSGLTHGRGMSENLHLTWMRSMHKSASVCAAMWSLTELDKSTGSHTANTSSSITVENTYVSLSRANWLGLEAVLWDASLVPDNILNIVHCKSHILSQRPCSTVPCSCRKHGLMCVTLAKPAMVHTVKMPKLTQNCVFALMMKVMVIMPV